MSDLTTSILLDDMLQATERSLEYVAGYTFETFLADTRTFDAVLRNLEVLGEAAAQVPDALRETHPGIPWRQIVGLRNMVIHPYIAVDPEDIWTIVTQQLPPLLPAPGLCGGGLRRRAGRDAIGMGSFVRRARAAGRSAGSSAAPDAGLSIPFSSRWNGGRIGRDRGSRPPPSPAVADANPSALSSVPPYSRSWMMRPRTGSCLFSPSLRPCSWRRPASGPSPPWHRRPRRWTGPRSPA